MSILETLKEIPVDNETALLGAIAAAMGYFFGGFFGFMKLPFTRRERNAEAAVNEASAMEIMASQIVESNKQVLVSNQHTVTLTQTITSLIENRDVADRERRKYEQERDEQHAAQIKALEQSLIESQESLKDMQERVTNLSEIVQKISIENEGKDRTIATHQRTIDDLNGRILKLEHDNKKAHQQLAERDNEIARLKARVAELEAKQQNTLPDTTSLVIAIGATDAPLKRETADVVVVPDGEAAIVEPPVNDGETQADVVPVQSAGDGA